MGVLVEWCGACTASWSGFGARTGAGPHASAPFKLTSYSYCFLAGDCLHKQLQRVCCFAAVTSDALRPHIGVSKHAHHYWGKFNYREACLKTCRGTQRTSSGAGLPGLGCGLAGFQVSCPEARQLPCCCWRSCCWPGSLLLVSRLGGPRQRCRQRLPGLQRMRRAA